MARARATCAARTTHVVAVIGDGALTGGMAFEGLNNAGSSRSDLLVVLNDNEMSIAPNVGALCALPDRASRTSPLYRSVESDVWELLGQLARWAAARRARRSKVKEVIKTFVVPEHALRGAGLHLLRPGRRPRPRRVLVHDLRQRSTTSKARSCCTSSREKGKGYAPAESGRRAVPRRRALRHRARRRRAKAAAGPTLHAGLRPDR